jgi:hypothetical protein
MRNSNLLLLTGLVSLILVGAKANAAKSKRSEEAVLRPTSTSPFAIERVVTKASRSWKQHRIEIGVDLSSTWKHLGIDPGVYDDCAYCESAIFKDELDDKPGREVILQLTKSFDSCRYLIFKRNVNASGKIRWKLLGHIDHDFNRYQMASHRIVRAFGRNWFVLHAQEGSGSGYYHYGETWFEVSNRSVRPVLNYSVEGGTDPGIGGLSWKLEGRPIAYEQRAAHSTIRLLFLVHYTAKGFEDGHMVRRFNVRRYATYVWNRKLRQFVFDPRRSTIFEREMNAVTNAGTEPDDEKNGATQIGGAAFFSSLKGFVGSGYEMFLRLNSSRLMKIAHRPGNATQEWLREFIKQCDDIPEKLALETALKDQLPTHPKRR